MEAARQILVVTYEQFFELPADAADVKEAIREALEDLRETAGARVVSSYVLEGGPHDARNRKWFDSSVDSIDMPTPGVITLAVD